jgi:hypothetical protein
MRGEWSQLVANLAAGGITITPDTAVTRWRGERMDYSIAVEALLTRSHRGALPGHVPAGTRRS